MLRALIFIGLTLVELHGPDNQRIWVNPEEVTNVRDPRGVNTGHWPPGTHCLLFMVSGNFIAVVERCDEVRRKLEQK